MEIKDILKAQADWCNSHILDDPPPPNGQPFTIPFRLVRRPAAERAYQREIETEEETLP